MNIVITLDYLKSQNACQDVIDAFIKKYKMSAELKTIINFAVKSKNKDYLEYCNWLITKRMNNEQRIQYAIFAAEQVLRIFENKYPEDDRPRKAIEAAKNYLKNKFLSDAADAADAAAYAAYAAYAAAYAAYAAYAAAVDADAAAYAAYAAYAAAYAAYAAYAAAYAAYAAYAAAVDADAAAYAAAVDAAYAAAYAADAAYAAAFIKIKSKILKYGIKIIYKEI